MIKVLLFDLDDTLYNERDFVYSGFISVAKFLSKKYKFPEDVLYFDMINILNTLGRGKIFDIICAKYNFNENINELVNIYRFNNPNITLYDDAREILQRFNGKYKFGIITDGYSKVQWNKIKALNIQKYMDKIIVTDDYGKEYWKPSIKPFLVMIEYFTVKPHECIYVGDNPNKDFIPCKKLGINSVRIQRPIGDYMNVYLDKEYEADYRIYSLLELENILAFLNRGE